MAPRIDVRALLARLDAPPGAIAAWAGIEDLICNHRAELGVGASVTDEELRATAPSIFAALVEICVRASREDDARAHSRLASLSWFLGGCHALLYPRDEATDTLH